ncbi:hypothetical protein GGF32_002294 [Allomyces javanicus]|nr:hypothetical protein GGF32_002294 [Allomyces javanicus]
MTPWASCSRSISTMDAPPSPSTSTAALGSPTPSHAALSATGSPPISPRAVRPDLIERGRRKLEKYQRRSASSLSDHSPTPLAHRSTPRLPGPLPSGDTSAALAAGNMVDGLDLASPEGLSTFLDRIRGLRDACTAMAAERDQLSAQLAAMRTTVAHRESVIEAMRNEVADARGHVAAVERDLAAVQTEMADRDAGDMRLEETIGDLKRELAQVATARDAMAAEVQTLEARLGTALDELAAATAGAAVKHEVDALRAELENERRHARHQRHELESALHVARAEANGLAQDLAAVKSELGVTTAQVAAVEAERDQLQLALQTKADMHHVALSDAEERVAANEHRARVAEERAAAMEAAMAQVRTEHETALAAVRDEHAAALEQLRDVHAATLAVAQEAAAAERAELQQQLADAQLAAETAAVSKSLEHEEAVADLQTNLDAARAQIDDLQHQIVSRDHQLVELHAEKENAIDLANQIQAACDQQLAEQRSVLEELEAKANQLAVEVEAARAAERGLDATSRSLPVEDPIPDLMAELESVRARLETTGAERDRFETDLAAVTMELNQIKTDLAAVTALASEQEAHVAEAEARAAQATDLVEQMTQELEQAKANVVEHEHALDAARAAATDAQLDWQAQIDEAREQCATVAAQVEQLVAARDAAESDRDTLREQCAQVEHALEVARQERDAANEKLVHVEAALEDAKQSRDAAQEKLAHVEEALLAAEHDRDAARDAIVAAETERDQTKQELVAVEADRSALRLDLQDLQFAADTARQDVHSHAVEIEHLQDDLATAQAARAKAERTVHELEGELEGVRTRCAELEHLEKDLEHLHAELDRIQDRTATEHARLVALVDDQAAQIAAATAERDQLVVELAEVQRHRNELDGERVNLLEDFQVATRDRDDAQRALNELEAAKQLAEDRFQVLAGQSNANLERLEALAKDRDEQARAAAQLRDLAASVQDQLEDALTKQMAAEADVAKWQEQVKRVEAQWDQEVAEMRDREEQLLDQIEVANQARDAIRADLVAAQKELESTCVLLHQARAELEARAEDDEDGQSEASDLREALHAQTEEVRLLNQELDQTAGQLAEWKRTAERAQARGDRLEQEKQKLTNELINLQEQLQLAAGDADVADLHKDLDLARQEASRWKTAADAAAAERKRAEAEFVEAMGRVASLTAAHDQLADQVEQLTHDRDTAGEKVTRLEDELSTVRAELARGEALREALTREVEATAAEVTAKSEQLMRAQVDVDESTKALAVKDHDLILAQSQLHETRTQLAGVQRQLERAKAMVAAQAASESTGPSKAKLQQDLAARDQQIAELRAQYQALVSQFHTITSKSAQLKQAVTEKINELAHRERAYDHEHAQFVQLERDYLHQIEGLKQEVEELVAARTHHEQVIADQDRALAEMEDEVRAVRSAASAAAAAMSPRGPSTDVTPTMPRGGRPRSSLPAPVVEDEYPDGRRTLGSPRMSQRSHYSPRTPPQHARSPLTTTTRLALPGMDGDVSSRSLDVSALVAAAAAANTTRDGDEPASTGHPADLVSLTDHQRALEQLRDAVHDRDLLLMERDTAIEKLRTELLCQQFDHERARDSLDAALADVRRQLDAAQDRIAQLEAARVTQAAAAPNVEDDGRSLHHLAQAMLALKEQYADRERERDELARKIAKERKYFAKLQAKWQAEQQQALDRQSATTREVAALETRAKQYKARYAKEATFRAALVQQKRYLTAVVVKYKQGYALIMVIF